MILLITFIVFLNGPVLHPLSLYSMNVPCKQTRTVHREDLERNRKKEILYMFAQTYWY